MEIIFRILSLILFGNTIRANTEQRQLHFYVVAKYYIFEPAHDKTYNKLVRPAKTQISLRIRAV